VGLTGLIGFSSGYHAILEADTLLMLGTDFPYTQFYPEKATIIQVDCRGENLGRRTRLDLGIIGDVKATLNALVPLLDEKKDDTHLKRFIDHYQDTRKGLDELAVGRPGHKPMHPQYVAKIVDEIAADDAIFCCDVGTPTVWAARYLTMNGKRRLLASVHKCLRIRDLCKELGIIVSTRILQAERERQAKTDACLVPSCPLASMVPVFWR
jgi:pyruvate dehydrogenase (quinone)